MNTLLKALAILLLASNGEAQGQTWRSFSDSAKIFVEQKNNSHAVEYYLKSNELLKKDSAQTLSYAQVNTELGDLLVAMGQYAKAEPHYATVHNLRSKLNGQESPEYAAISNSLGRLYRNLGMYDKAMPLLQESVSIREKIFGKNNADYATSANNLAIVYLETGNHDQAAVLYKEVKDIRERILGKDHVDYATSCNNLAIYYVVTGQYLQAEPLYLEAKQIREKKLGKEHPFYAASCNNLAALYMDRGQFQKAEPLYIESREIRERTLGKEHPDYAASCDNLAILYMDRGQYEKAEQLYIEAKAIREKVLGKKHPDYGRSCNNMALYFRNLGQYEKSLALFSEARQILGDVFGKEHFEYGKCCNNLGAIYMDMGLYEKARFHYEEARKIWEKVLGNEHPEYAKSCHNIGLMERFAGNLESAEKWLLEAKSIREKVLGKDNIEYAATCDNLGIVYIDLGNYKRAGELHLEALNIRENAFGTEHPEYLTSCINLANLYRLTHEARRADSLFQRAFSSQNVQVNKVFRFTAEKEKQSYLRKINELKNHYLSFHFGENTTAGPGFSYDISLSNRQLILTSLQQLRQSALVTGDSTIANRYQEWINTREQLAFLYAKPLEQRKEEVRVLEAKADQLEKQLVRTSVASRIKLQADGWKELKKALRPGEAAIEFLEFQYYTGKRWTDSVYYMAVVLRNDKTAPELVSLFEKRELDALLNYKGVSPGQHKINMLYSSGSSQPAVSGNRSLYKLVWDPLETALKGINAVYFAPAGILHKLAFPALRDRNDKLLGEKYILVQLNSTAAVKQPTSSTIGTKDQIVLYGGIQYEADSASMRQAIRPYSNQYFASRSYVSDSLKGGIGEFQYLPESEKETHEISRIAREKQFNVSVFDKLNASEESFTSLSGKKSPTILHMATHGFFFHDPAEQRTELTRGGHMLFQFAEDPLMRSGLVLAGANNAWKGNAIDGIKDGILTSYEISNMSLPNTKLAVLSACETGLGDVQGSEGVYGLQRAFKLAGVENLVMSLWKVPDVETALFMQEFYKGLLERKPVHLAFAGAQQFMKNKFKNDPFRWAAWVLVR